MVSFNPFNWLKQAKDNPSDQATGSPSAYSGQEHYERWDHSIFDGGKFSGGFGPTQVQIMDYWTLRARSSQLFNENLYARGIIRRLVTNEINTGLTLEACPEEIVIGVPEDSLNEWTELIESRFTIWGNNPDICCAKKQMTFGEIQRVARMESLVAGDVLVIIRTSRKYGLPYIELVDGSLVQSPLTSGYKDMKEGHTIRHGVEMDANGMVVAHWIRKEDGSSERILARGGKSGRKISWLVYGTDKRMDEIRGQPLLSIVLQSLKEIDRYRDSTQRKAVINSILALFIKKSHDKMSTLPISGGAIRKGTDRTVDNQGTRRNFGITSHIPGMIMEELEVGEEPVLKGGEGTDINFGDFEEAIIQSVAWANEIPPEILRLSFSNNYSASQAAINEFKIYLNKIWGYWADNFCCHIYSEWLLSETLLQKVRAPGLLESWRDPSMYDIYGAWIMSDWYGSIKPSTDTLKQARGSKMLVDEGWTTNAREARVTTGTKYSKNIKRLRRENELKVSALQPLMDFKKELSDMGVNTSQSATSSEDITASIIEAIEESGSGSGFIDGLNEILENVD